MRALLLILAGLLWVLPVQAATRAELEVQVQTLNERVQTLEKRMDVLLARLDSPETSEDMGDTRVAQALNDSMDLDAPKPEPSLRTLRIGGRVKLDVIANSISVGGAGGQNRADVSFFPSAIPLDKAGEDRQLSGNARDSRIWLNAINPTPYGDLGAYIEMDFGSYDNSANERVSNSHNPRIRHAYATFSGFTMGQTTSTFQNMLAFPEMNEGNGPVGVLNTRQPLIRYTREVGRYSWSVAAEQPETTLTASDGRRLSFDDDQLPDLVGRIDWQNEKAILSLAALVREIRVDDVVESQVVDEQAVGAGISLSGRWFLQGADNFRFALAAGRGIGRYVSYNSFNDAYLDNGGELQPIPVTSTFIAYQHWWSDKWRSNLALGFAQAELDRADYSTGLINERYLSSHLNLLWSPIPSATFGVEWVYGRRELLNGMTGNLNRLQFTSLYKFRQ